MRGENGEIVADYTRRKGVLFSKIVAPPLAPKWVLDRQSLWINACAKETRKNSVEAREFEVAIPSGLSIEEATELVEHFAIELVKKHRFVIDFSLHSDSRTDWTGAKKNFMGYHAHMTATTRRIDADGFNEKTREFDDQKSGVIYFWRRRWAELANEHLERAGLATRIDHRSHKNRGINREPTKHLGPSIVALERRGIKTRHGDYARSLLRAFALGVQARETTNVASIDLISSVSQALAARDQIQNTHQTLISKTKKLLIDLEFDNALEELSKSLYVIPKVRQSQAKTGSCQQRCRVKSCC